MQLTTQVFFRYAPHGLCIPDKQKINIVLFNICLATTNTPNQCDTWLIPSLSGTVFPLAKEVVRKKREEMELLPQEEEEKKTKQEE